MWLWEKQSGVDSNCASFARIDQLIPITKIAAQSQIAYCFIDVEQLDFGHRTNGGTLLVSPVTTLDIQL